MKASDVKKGNVVEHDGTVYQVRDIERSSPSARGGNVTFRFTLYSIPGGRKFDLSLRADDELREMDLVRRAANFSYMDDGAFVFMDAEDYTQYPLSPELVGDNAGYIVEGIEGYYVQLIDDAPVGLQVPSSVILTVVDTAPEMKGSSATKRNKPAKLSTGIELQVPEYISNDEKVWVNTITGEFAGAAHRPALFLPHSQGFIDKRRAVLKHPRVNFSRCDAESALGHLSHRHSCPPPATR
jgi:elongation factor P